MSGTIKVSQLPLPIADVPSFQCLSVQNVGGVLTDVLVPILAPGVAPASVTSTTGTNLTAANMLTGVIARTGPTAAFTDTLDTAADIISAIAGSSDSYGFNFLIQNFTAYQMTLTAGTGMSFVPFGSQTLSVQPQNVVAFRVTITDTTSGSSAVEIYRLWSAGI